MREIVFYFWTQVCPSQIFSYTFVYAMQILISFKKKYLRPELSCLFIGPILEGQLPSGTNHHSGLVLDLGTIALILKTV
jgi:hypothetical protein